MAEQMIELHDAITKKPLRVVRPSLVATFGGSGGTLVFLHYGTAEPTELMVNEDEQEVLRILREAQPQ